MAQRELFIPIGSLALSPEQIERLQGALGRNFAAIPLYQVAAVSPSDRFVPLSGVPGLCGVVVHFEPRPHGDKPDVRLVASIQHQMIGNPDMVFEAEMRPRAKPAAHGKKRSRKNGSDNSGRSAQVRGG